MSCLHKLIFWFMHEVLWILHDSQQAAWCSKVNLSLCKLLCWLLIVCKNNCIVSVLCIIISPKTHCRYTMHNWLQCPEGDIRPEAILSRASGSSGTTRHHQVTLCKGPEWLHKPMYDFETPLRFCLGGHHQIFSQISQKYFLAQKNISSKKSDLDPGE